MPFTITALSLFCQTRELEKTHHLVVVEYGCMNKFVSGVVNLAQIIEHIIQMFAKKNH